MLHMLGTFILTLFHSQAVQFTSLASQVPHRRIRQEITGYHVSPQSVHFPAACVAQPRSTACLLQAHYKPYQLEGTGLGTVGPTKATRPATGAPGDVPTTWETTYGRSVNHNRNLQSDGPVSELARRGRLTKCRLVASLKPSFSIDIDQVLYMHYC
jgi:hypothetical protein